MNSSVKHTINTLFCIVIQVIKLDKIKQNTHRRIGQGMSGLVYILLSYLSTPDFYGNTSYNRTGSRMYGGVHNEALVTWAAVWKDAYVSALPASPLQYAEFCHCHSGTCFYAGFLPTYRLPFIFLCISIAALLYSVFLQYAVCHFCTFFAKASEAEISQYEGIHCRAAVY